jgi:hypothetical protein
MKKTLYAAKIAFQKALFEQKRVQKGLLHNFLGVKNGIFKNCT